MLVYANLCIKHAGQDVCDELMQLLKKKELTCLHTDMGVKSLFLLLGYVQVCKCLVTLKLLRYNKQVFLAL